MLTSVRIAIAIVVVSACSTSYQPARGRAAGTVPRASRHGYTTLHVLNRNAEDVRVFLVRSGTRVAVGTVESLSARSFSLSLAETGTFGTLTLAVETLASRQQHTAELIDFEPGQEIDWRIEGQLAYSQAQARVYRRQ